MNICLLLVLLLPALASAQTGLYVPAGGTYDVGDGTVDLGIAAIATTLARSAELP